MDIIVEEVIGLGIFTFIVMIIPDIKNLRGKLWIL